VRLELFPLRAGYGSMLSKFFLDIRGTTLIEVSVSFVLLMIAVVMMFNLFTFNAVISERAGDTTKAVNIAQAYLEELKVQDILQTGTAIGTREDGYQYQVNIIESEYSGLYKVEVTVADPNVKQQKSIILKSLLWKR